MNRVRSYTILAGSALVVIVLLCVYCASQGPADVVKQLVKASANKDKEAFLQLLPRDLRARVVSFQERLRWEGYFEALNERWVGGVTVVLVKTSEEEGGKAEVYTTAERGKQRFKLVREDGKWKVDGWHSVSRIPTE